MTIRTNVGKGWIPDLPDQRDHVYSAMPRAPIAVPPKVDLRAQCPPVYDQGSIGSCHDDKTEVLTDRGFKPFTELDGSERLATVNPETAQLFFEAPTRIVRFPYQGKIHCVANQSLNFKVTPDHKMLVRRWNESKRTLDDLYEMIEAKNVGWYFGLMNRVRWAGEIESETFTLPGVAHKHKEQRDPKDISLASWVRFLGLYLAEGTMLKRDERGEGRISYKVQIAASKEREKEAVRATLAEIGVSALELADRFTFSNRRVFEAMSSLGLEGVKAGQKFVPSFIFRLSAEMIAEFLAGHFAGDGSEQRGVRAHYTSSARLAADLQALIFMSGNETRMSVREARSSMMADGRSVVGTLPEHRVSVCERKNLSVDKKKKWFEEDYDGEVFCAEVPTHHTLVTRREGKILISGNCTANAIGGAIEFDLMKQGLPAVVPSRLFIYYNERAMEGTVGSDSGAMIRDGIKTVAKQGTCSEALWPYREAWFKRRPLRACYRAATGCVIGGYARLDTLDDMRSRLASGSPFVFGFSVYEAFESDEVARTGVVPMPKRGERLLGGHAVLAVGYDDGDDGGRFIARNSWSENWGQGGYFTIPYSYLEDRNLSDDFWSIESVSGPVKLEC